MEPTKPQQTRPTVGAGALVVRLLLSQVVGLGAAFAVFLLELGVIRFLITSLPPEQMQRAKDLALFTWPSHPAYAGPVLYVLLLGAALSAAMICQSLFLWHSPAWREGVYNRHRQTPVKTIREAVGIRWTVFTWLLPFSLVAAPWFLWYASK